MYLFEMVFLFTWVCLCPNPHDWLIPSITTLDLLLKTGCFLWFGQSWHRSDLKARGETQKQGEHTRLSSKTFILFFSYNNYNSLGLWEGESLMSELPIFLGIEWRFPSFLDWVNSPQFGMTYCMWMKTWCQVSAERQEQDLRDRIDSEKLT